MEDIKEVIETKGIRIELTEVDGGVDVRIAPVDGYVATTLQDTDGITVLVRTERMPNIGETVMAGPENARKAVVVDAREWDDTGHLWLTDRNTHENVRWV